MAAADMLDAHLARADLRAARRRVYAVADPTSWDDIDLAATIARAVDSKLDAMDNGCHGHTVTGITAHRTPEGSHP